LNLLTESLWRDEAFAALLSRHDPSEIIGLSAGDATPPLFYLVLHFWLAAFGDSEVAMRALTFLFFVATGFVMFLLGSRLGGNARWWLLAFSLSQPFLFRYGFEVRAYSLLALLTATTILFFIRRDRLALAISATALVYTHLFGVWIVAVLLGWAVLRREPIVPLLVPLAASLPWAANYVSFGRAATGWWLPPPTVDNVALYLVKIGAPLLLVIVLVARPLARQPLFPLAALLFLTPIVGALAVSQIKPVFLDRYLIVVVPAELLLLALPAATTRHFRYLAAIVIVAQVGAGAYLFSHPVKPPFRELAAYLESERLPGDVVVNMDPLTYFESHYYGLDSKILSPTANIPIYMGSVLIPASDVITALPAGADRYFWIEIHDVPNDRHPLALPLVDTKDFGKVTLSLYLAH
jgi:uncharacterized membrane protein